MLAAMRQRNQSTILCQLLCIVLIHCWLELQNEIRFSRSFAVADFSNADGADEMSASPAAQSLRSLRLSKYLQLILLAIGPGIAFYQVQFDTLPACN